MIAAKNETTGTNGTTGTTKTNGTTETELSQMSRSQMSCMSRVSRLREGWKTVKLGEVADYAREKISVSEISIENYISTENMLPEKGGVCKASSIPEDGYATSFKKGNILISNIRPYFKKIWLAKWDSGCSNDVLVVRGKEIVNSRYLAYLLSDDVFFSYVMAGAKGTKMPRGDRQQILEYEFSLPPLPTQRKIAAVLGALDDKIENNRKICANLEAQAQALFKSWFVDFEPFGGKMPKDWKMGKLGDVVESMINGDWGKDKSEGKNNSPVYCIRGADIPAVVHGEKGKMPLRYILPQNYQKKELVDGNIVVEISGGSPTQSTGRAALITQSLLMRYNRGLVCTNFCKAIKPIKGYSYFLYFYWRYLYDKGIFFQYENGTTGIKNLDINGILTEYSIALPDAKINSEFNFRIRECVELIFQKGHENEKLAELRDALLPKLMSGELDVDDVEV